jgi:hypothetical protein
LAGFAVMFDPQESPTAQTADWAEFLHFVADLKCLDEPGSQAAGLNCIAAKLDAPCSLHRGVTLDPKTGSWLLAVGTVVDPRDNQPDGSLSRLLQDYLDSGLEVFSRLDGQFGLVLYDARESKLLVVSDPFGLISLYYGRLNHKIYISTSALAIARVIRSRPDEERIRAFLLYGDTLGGTLWRDVRMLPPATALLLTRDRTAETQYWALNVDASIARLPLDESIDCIIESMSRSMQQSLLREGKTWVSITGGMDSRTLAALMQYSRLPFKSYCHGPVDSRDVHIAADISHQMGWDYEYFPLPDDWGVERSGWLSRALGQTDGHLDVLKLSRTIREQTIKAQQLNVSLWGYSGEVYRGYYWKQEFWRTGATSVVNYDHLRDYRVTPLDGSVLIDGERWKKQISADLISLYKAVGEREPDWVNTAKLDAIGLCMERPACGHTISAVLGQQRVILPYDFKENIIRNISINDQYRNHGRLFRLVLERINPDLAGIETADGGPALPMRLSNAHRFIPYWLDASEKMLWKLGYKYLKKALWNKRDAGPSGRAYPVAKWLRDSIDRLNDQAFFEFDQMASAGLYDEARLKSLLTDSTAGSRSNETLISRIITIEMAMRRVGSGL